LKEDKETQMNCTLEAQEKKTLIISY
jgi:hypothetical protein